MKGPYLEVTFRRGQPLAAYYYLPRRPGDKSYRTARIQPGLIIDFNRSSRPIGIEITSPGRVSLAAMNRVLRELGVSEIKRADLGPPRAA